MSSKTAPETSEVSRDGQRFRAAIVKRPFHEDERILWFSTDVAAAPPQVCLLLTSSAAPAPSSSSFFLELNGQQNGRCGFDVERIEASRTRLRILFRRGKGIFPGYVNTSGPRRVRRIEVSYSLDEATFARLALLLEGARRDGCAVRVTRRSGGTRPFTAVEVAG